MIFIFSAKPPTFTSFGPFYLFKDSQGVLKCQPDAAPPPEFRWYKGDTEITTGGRYTVSQDGTLLIKDVTEQDAGQYKCWAKNFLKETFSPTAPAYVLGKE